MTKQNYIVDMEALYECLQFLPQMKVNGELMVPLENVLAFLDCFPKEPINVVSDIVLDEDSLEMGDPLEHPCDNCDTKWGALTPNGYTSCQVKCKKLAEFWKKTEV